MIPELEQWQKQGEQGTKINQWTRYVTVVLALLQSTGLVFLFHSGDPTSGGLGVDIFPQGEFAGAETAARRVARVEQERQAGDCEHARTSVT